MFDPVTAIAGASAIGGVAGLGGSYLQARAEEKAGNAQAGAATYAAQLQNQQFEENRADMAPWRQAGAGALGQLSGMTGPGGSLIQPFQFSTTGPNADPSYQWRVQQGEQAVNQNAALGGYFRGQTGIDLQTYGQGAASQEYGAQFNRSQAQNTNIYNMLAGISGTGQAATQQTGNWGMQSATNQGNFGMQGAQAQGAAGVGAAQAWAGGINNLTNQGMGGLGMYMNYNMMNNYLNGGLNNMNSFPGLT